MAAPDRSPVRVAFLLAAAALVGLLLWACHGLEGGHRAGNVAGEIVIALLCCVAPGLLLNSARGGITTRTEAQWIWTCVGLMFVAFLLILRHPDNLVAGVAAGAVSILLMLLGACLPHSAVDRRDEDLTEDGEWDDEAGI